VERFALCGKLVLDTFEDFSKSAEPTKRNYPGVPDNISGRRLWFPRSEALYAQDHNLGHTF